jgi:O-antigen/teichoic acid export membrane protein
MYKKLLTDSAIYGFGAILVKSLAFFTLPIYTSIFSPEEYGVIEMFATISGILSILMTMGLDSAQSFYFMEAKNDKARDIKEVTGAILQLRIIFGLSAVILSTLFSSFILEFAFNELISVDILWMVLASTFFATLVSQSLEIFRLIYKPWYYIGLTFFQSIGGIGFILFFTYINDEGISGYFKGMALGSFIALIIGWFSTKNYRTWKRKDLKLWREYLKFGIPLMPAGLMVWITMASDRWFVMNMLSSYDVGIYAIGAKFALLITLGVETFRKAWWPIAMDMLHKEEGPQFFKTISLWYVGIGSLSAIVLTIISPYLVSFIADDRYYESWKIVGVLCWGSLFYGFYLISLMGIFKSKKTYLNIYIHGGGAVLNIILNFVLIPVMGIIGAAISTSISVMVNNVVGMIISNKYYKIDWNWGYYVVIISVSWVIILRYIEVI